MTKWTKPSGLKIELNDEEATRKEAIKLDWRTGAMIADDEREAKEKAKAKAKAKAG